MSDIAKINERFNRYVIKLLNIAESSGGIDNCTSLLIKQSLKDLNKINPLLVMSLMGKYLMENNDLIKSSNEQFLINLTNKQYLKQKINEYNIPHSDSDIDVLNDIVASIYNKWGTYDDEQKKIIFKLFQILLSEYSKYLHLTII